MSVYCRVCCLDLRRRAFVCFTRARSARLVASRLIDPPSRAMRFETTLRSSPPRRSPDVGVPLSRVLLPSVGGRVRRPAAPRALVLLPLPSVVLVVVALLLAVTRRARLVVVPPVVVPAVVAAGVPRPLVRVLLEGGDADGEGDEKRARGDEAEALPLDEARGIESGARSRGAPVALEGGCLLYTSPSPRDQRGSRMPSSA